MRTPILRQNKTVMFEHNGICEFTPKVDVNNHEVSAFVYLTFRFTRIYEFYLFLICIFFTKVNIAPSLVGK